MDSDRWSRVEQIFHQASALSGADRIAFLASACGDDRTLLAEVESLLAEEGGDPFLEEPALAVAARLVADEIPVLAGRSFGPYRIDGLIGSGGMGDVYRARDTVLGRDVAIKILPEAFKDDPERLARFEQEAQFLASLSHPNVAAIYGVHESDGIRGLVLELVDGETLSDRIRRGPMPLHDVVRIARQIGEGLDAAHQRGIVHRDLKPSNIKIARDGTTKILDFGLAKSVAADRPESGSPTVQSDGRVLGTASYMSPEQARGDFVDKRTDIWAFGCVCFEMLTGQPAFRRSPRSADGGATSQIAPRWDLMPSSVPPGIIALFKRCLEEDPNRRRRDVGDVLVDLDEALHGGSAPAQRSIQPRWLALSAISVLIVATVALMYLSRPRDTASAPHDFKLSLLVPPGMHFPEQNSQVAISADGTMVAYAAAAGSQAPQLIVRTLASGADRILNEALEPRHPFFSPDGQWIGFFSGDAIRKISLADGRSQTLARAALAQTGWWGHGFLLFGTGGDLASDGIRRVPEQGGEIEVLTRPDKAAGEFNHFSPQLLPDGLTLMYSARTPYGPHPSARLMVKRPGVAARVLLDDAHSGHYVGNSWLIYQQGRSLFVTRLDLETLTVSGRGELLFDDAAMDGRPRWASAGGILVYRSLLHRSQNDNRQLVWVNRRGEEAVLSAPARQYEAPALSPNGDRIAVGIEDEGKFDIWTLDAKRPAVRQLTFDGASRYPIWTPDGRHIGIAQRSQKKLYWLTPEGRASRDIVQGKSDIWFGSWTTDMRTLVYMEENDVTRSDIWAVNLESKTPPRPVVKTNAREYGGRVSPDGKWVAYFSDAGAKQHQLYLTTLAPGGPHVQISTTNERARAREAVWGRNDRELMLFYRQGSEMLSVRIPSDGRSPHPPTRVFEGDYYLTGGPGIVNFDVSADGRFLMLKPLENHTPHLTVVQGLDRLIRERLQPTSR